MPDTSHLSHVPRRRGTCEYCCQTGTVYAFILWTCADCLAHDTGDSITPVCDRCQLPAAFIHGRWQHASAAGAMFCSIIYPEGPPA